MVVLFRFVCFETFDVKALTFAVFDCVDVSVCLFLQGFVSKLDEFICWLRDALETTDNWTPPRADIDSLKLYLETHLVSKRLSVRYPSVCENSHKLTNEHMLSSVCL